MSLAYLFPGQGAQTPGFLHRLPQHPAVSATLDEAAAVLGIDVMSLDDVAALASTVAVHLNAPVTISAIVLAVALAVLGGLIAGGFGGWRAARLRPAAALSKVA